MVRVENPIPTWLSVAVSTFTSYSIYEMINHGVTTNIGTVTSIMFGFAMAYTVTIDGMGKHGEVNNISGINKLGAIIAIQYALLTPNAYDVVLGFIDSRYSTIKAEYEAIPKYDKLKLERVLSLDKVELNKRDNYLSASKNAYFEYKNNPSTHIEYSKLSALKQERDNLKSYEEKIKSEYSKLVNKSKICNPKNSDDVAKCIYSTELLKLEMEYDSKLEYVDTEYPIYRINGEVHSLKYRQQITNNSNVKFKSELKDKANELKKIEDRLPFNFWMMTPILWIFGFFFETRIANMNVFTRHEISRKEKDGLLNTNKKMKKVHDNSNQLRILAEHNNMLRNLSSSDGFITWCKRANNNFKLNRDIATLHAIIKCTLSVNPTDLISKKGDRILTANSIQNFVEFVNPNSKGKSGLYKVVNSQSKIRTLLHNEKALVKNKFNDGWVIDETKLKEVLKTL